MFRLLHALIIVITAVLAMLMCFSALACHMQGHPNKWPFTLAAFVTSVLFMAVATGKEPRNGT